MQKLNIPKACSRREGQLSLSTPQDAQVIKNLFDIALLFEAAELGGSTLEAEGTGVG